MNLLLQNGIPYACRENDALFFTGKVVSDILNLLTFCENPSKRELLLDLVPRLGIGLSAAAREEIEKAAAQNADADIFELICDLAKKHGRENQAETLKTVLGNIRGKSAYCAIKELYEGTSFGRFLEKRCCEPTKLSVLLALAGQCGTIDEFLSRMKYLSESVKHHENPKDTICPLLSTVHSSKGLEFDNVIIIDVRNGIFPSEVPTRFMAAEKRAFLEEERRLFYVALTRARKSVKIYVCEKEFGAPCVGSQFLDEIFRIDVQKCSPARKRSFARPAWAPVDLSAYKVGTQVSLSDGDSGVIESLDGDIARINVDGNLRSFNLTLAVKSGYIQRKA